MKQLPEKVPGLLVIQIQAVCILWRFSCQYSLINYASVFATSTVQISVTVQNCLVDCDASTLYHVGLQDGLSKKKDRATVNENYIKL